MVPQRQFGVVARFAAGVFWEDVMGKREKVKGKRWEREVARKLREQVFTDCPDSVRRGWQTRKGDDDPDVISPAFSIECKVGKVIPMAHAIRQAKASANGKDWLVVAKVDRQPATVTMDFDAFLDMACDWWGER